MKFAFIPPKSFLWRYVAGGNFEDMHMILPALQDDKGYASFYRNARGYKIVDNGAAEGEMLDNAGLIEFAQVVQAHEVVMPDVIGDPQGTLEAVQAFTPFALRHTGFNYMGVVHGHNFEDIVTLLKLYAQLPFVTTIGIPRVLAKTMDDKQARLSVLNEIGQDMFTLARFQFHLLGAYDWIEEPKYTPRWVRSIDTSMPGVLAMAGIRITNSAAVGIRRQDNYFEWVPDPDGLMLCSHNIETYREWCR